MVFKNTQIRHFWSQIQEFLVFLRNLELDKFEGADFKYDNRFFKTVAQKYPQEAFLVQNLGIFIISRNLATRQIQGCWFKIWQYCFQTPVQKYPNKAFWVPNLAILVFCKILQLGKFEGADFKHDDIFL